MVDILCKTSGYKISIIVTGRRDEVSEDGLLVVSSKREFMLHVTEKSIEVDTFVS